MNDTPSHTRSTIFPYTTLFRSNGGVKKVAKTQDDEHLKESEYAMRWVNQCLEKALEDGRFSVDYNRKITGITSFNRSEEHTSELQSRGHLVCRLLLEKKKKR